MRSLKVVFYCIPITFFLFAACVIGGTEKKKSLGGPGQECYENRTCNAGMDCVYGICRTSEKKPDPPPPPPPTCTPDKYFCNGAQIRQCTNTGLSSVLWSDCSTVRIGGVSASASCGLCSGLPKCIQKEDMGSATVSGGFVTGSISNYKVHSCRTFGGPSISSWWASNGYAFSFSNGSSFRLSFAYDSGKGRPLSSGSQRDFHTGDGEFRLTLSKGGVDYYAVKDVKHYTLNKTFDAPSKGSVRLTWRGKTAMSSYSLYVSVYVTEKVLLSGKDDPPVWKKITIQAQGKNTM